MPTSESIGSEELTPAEREIYYLPSEVAAMLGVSPRTIANWCDLGILQAILTPTGQRRILASSLKGGRAYDTKKVAFVERMTRKRGNTSVPSGKAIAETVLEGRRAIEE
ncbi:Helix-turn-helix domain protein [compost metagenome]